MPLHSLHRGNSWVLNIILSYMIIFSKSTSSMSRDPGIGGSSGTDRVLSQNIIEVLTSLGKELHYCQWRKIIILYDSDLDIDKPLFHHLTFIKRLAIPFTAHKVGKNQSASFVLDRYVTDHVTNFVIISKNADDILEEIHQLFFIYSKTVLSAFPHRSNWLLFMIDGSEIDARHSLLDNVALVEFNSNDSGSVKTLMWRKGRSRQWDVIDRKSLDSASCVIYPNKRNGLNGREISWLSSPYSYCSYVTFDPQGNAGYVGFLVEIVNMLGAMLNFTAKFVPATDDPFLPIVDQYGDFLRNTSSDFGLSIFSQDFAVKQGLKGTYPVVQDVTVAAYIFKPRTVNIKATILNFGRSSSHFNCLLQICGNFLYAVVFYKLISYFTSFTTYGGTVSLIHEDSNMGQGLKELCDSTSDETVIDLENRATFSGDTPDLPERESPGRFSDGTQVKPEKKSDSIGEKLCMALWCVSRNIPNLEIIRFLGAHLNQSTIMRPKLLSLRLFIFSWCFYVLLMTCLFTGTLTSKFVKPMKTPPFTTLSQVLQSPDVTFGTFEMTELASRSEAWTIDGHDWPGHLDKFRINFTTTPTQFRKFMEESARNPKVFVYYKGVLNYLKYHSQFDDLYITDDYFQQALLGFVAQDDSELVDTVSAALNRLHESGIISKIIEPYQGPRIKKTKSEKKPARTSIDNSFLKELFFLVMVCTLMATLALGSELLMRNRRGFLNTREVV